jgi:hypothetical protein
MAQVYKSAGVVVAKIVGNGSSALDEVAARVQAAAVGLAAQHIETGRFESSITTRRVPGKSGVSDRMVSATDPAAVSIEEGHLTRRGQHMHGPQRHVPGLHIMARAAGAA